MHHPEDFNNHRQFPRITISLPIAIKIDSLITITGQIKDLSINSAFVKIKSSIHMAINDEYSFNIQTSSKKDDPLISGIAYISRIVKEEGIGLYFIKMDTESSKRLKEIVESRL